MKLDSGFFKTIIRLFLIGILFLACKEKDIPKQAYIQITTDVDSIAYGELMRPQEGILLWDNKKDTIFKNENGNFVIEVPLDQPEFVRLKLGEDRFRMILMPDERYDIQISKGIPSFSQDNANGQHAFNNSNREPAFSFDFINLFTNDTIPEQLISRIRNLKNDEMEVISGLKENLEINDAFYELIKKDIDYYYASTLVAVLNYRKGQDLRPFAQEIDNLVEKTFDEYANPEGVLPMSWLGYTEARTQIAIQEKWNPQALAAKIEQDSLDFVYADIIKNTFSKNFQERLLADYILKTAKQQRFEKSLLTLFTDFKTTYPQSNFIEYLEKDITSIREYHERIKADLPVTSTLVTYSGINNFQSLLDKFKGQKLYIDMWATWCGPCKQEFKYNKEVNKVLKNHDYKKLYITLDEVDAYDKWIENIKYYELEGYHYFANKKDKELFKDFEKNYSIYKGYIAIPQYLLLDENGVLTTINAPRPSAYVELEEVLATAL